MANGMKALSLTKIMLTCVITGINEAKEYLEKTRIKTALTNQLIKISDPDLGALLVKNSQMESLGIQFNLEITNSLEDLPLKTHDFSIILANLLYNAIEAILAEPSPQPEICLEITQKCGIWDITVTENHLPIKNLKNIKQSYTWSCGAASILQALYGFGVFMAQ